MNILNKYNFTVDKAFVEKYIFLTALSSLALLFAALEHGLALPFIMLGSGSTPFIRTWNGKKFEYENDFLFGKPNALFCDKEHGMRLYESGKITPDLYKIQNKVELKNGNFIAQIKEIEPEESYIGHISLSRVVYPKNTELVVDSKFEKMHAFEKSALEGREGVVSQKITLDNEDISKSAGYTKNIWKKMNDNDGYMLEPGEYIEIEGTIQDKNAPAYLLLRAHHRDWMAGEILNDQKITDMHKQTSVVLKISTFFKQLHLRAEKELNALS